MLWKEIYNWTNLLYMKFAILLLLFGITYASPRMRGSHRFIVQGGVLMYVIITDTLTASMQSDQNYDVVNLPITVSIHFSSSVSRFDSSQCVVWLGDDSQIDGECTSSRATSGVRYFV